MVCQSNTVHYTVIQTDKQTHNYTVHQWNKQSVRQVIRQTHKQAVSGWGYHRLRPSPLQMSDTGWVTTNLPLCYLLISLGLCCCHCETHMLHVCVCVWERERERERGRERISTVLTWVSEADKYSLFTVSWSTAAGSLSLSDSEFDTELLIKQRNQFIFLETDSDHEFWSFEKLPNFFICRFFSCSCCFSDIKRQRY